MRYEEPMCSRFFHDDDAFLAWCESGDGLTWDEWIEVMEEPRRPFLDMFETPVGIESWRPMLVELDGEWLATP